MAIRNIVTKEVALASSDNPNELQQLLRGVYSGSGRMDY